MAENLRSVDELVLEDPNRAHDVLRDAHELIGLTTRLLHNLSPEGENFVDESTTEEIVRMHVEVLDDVVPIDLEVQGDLPHGGQADGVVRLVQNLLINAVRETQRAGGGVAICLRDGELTVSNRVCDACVMDESIYERGVSGADSSGVGLAIARQMATQIGWELDHRVEGEHVTFRTGPAQS